MADSFTQVPPDSTGDKLHMRSRVRGADTVLQQSVFLSHGETWSGLADAVAFAANKFHISILNAAGSGKCVTIHDLRWVNLSIAAVTGVGIRFDVKKITAHSGGTALTPDAWDTINAALPAQVTLRTGATSVTEGNLLFPFTANNDENPLTGLNPQMMGNSILPGIADPKSGALVLREGQGLCVKQITSSTIGSWAWILQFSIEDTWS